MPSGRPIRTLYSLQAQQRHQRGVVALAFLPDGRTLLTGDVEGNAFLWEVATGSLVRTWTPHSQRWDELALSADGKTLVTEGGGILHVWDIPELILPARLRRAPAPAERPALWADLLSADAATAYRAMARLEADPAGTVAFLAECLKAASAPDPNSLAALERLLRGLDADTFEEREQASREMERLGRAAETALKKYAAGKLSPEARRRVNELLRRLPRGADPLPPAEVVRALRAVAVLEHVDTPGARKLLERLAAGHKEARLTREASQSLQQPDRMP